ncbi:MAG: hypothetical protein D6701_14160 [Gemmatimonadetes bacterium]|nr:MAG: hypothetical protein D6701_14160 [Gemmatimonadota bacterium]
MRGWRGRAAAVAIGVALLAACGDSASAPLVSVVTAESRGAIEIAVPLPTPDRLAREVGLDEELDGALAVWEASWAATPERGGAVRDSVRMALAAGLATRVSARRAGEAAGELKRVVDDIGELPEGAVVPGLAERLAEARDAVTRASLAAREGRVEEALQGTLAAADAVEALRPRRVAQALTAEVEALSRREGGLDAYPDETRGRIVRLLEGARDALLLEDYPRAIRRGYYACRLLGGCVGAR